MYSIQYWYPDTQYWLYSNVSSKCKIRSCGLHCTLHWACMTHSIDNPLGTCGMITVFHGYRYMICIYSMIWWLLCDYLTQWSWWTRLSQLPWEFPLLTDDNIYVQTLVAWMNHLWCFSCHTMLFSVKTTGIAQQVFQDLIDSGLMKIYWEEKIWCVHACNTVGDIFYIFPQILPYHIILGQDYMYLPENQSLRKLKYISKRVSVIFFIFYCTVYDAMILS